MQGMVAVDYNLALQGILFYMIKKSGQNNKWDVQLRKGTLELVILSVLRGRKVYGLEILKSLHILPTMQITEGTLYPLLDRLKREGLIAAEWIQTEDTRPRKYYHLTQSGESKLKLLSERWSQSVSDIKYLLNNPGPKPLDQ